MSGQIDVTEHVLQCMALEEEQVACARVPSGPAPWDVNARNSKGESALEIAALNGKSYIHTGCVWEHSCLTVSFAVLGRLRGSD